MSIPDVFRGLSILFLLLAGYQAYVWFESFQIGATSAAAYALRIAAPLFMSVAMQILTRKLGRASGGGV